MTPKKILFVLFPFLFFSSALSAEDFSLPPGFEATVFADDLGYARHLAVRSDGAVYTILRRRVFGPGLVAMIDDDGDGVADRVERFGSYRGTGVDFYKGYLYFATTSAIYRYHFEGNELVPTGDAEVVIGGLSNFGNHTEKPFTFDGQGNIYVNFGAPSNACQRISRTRGSRGQNPCPQLENRAVTDDLGYARHLAVRSDGAVYTILRRRVFGPGLVAMIDDDGDGVADRVERFGSYRGTGVDFYKGYLYFATTSAIYRYHFEGNELVPTGDAEVVIGGLSNFGNHTEKPFTFDGQGNIYVNFGAPSNACQRISRTRGSRGQNPCPQLENRAGIWKFSADTLGQTADDGQRYVTGIRNAMGLDWNLEAGALFFTTHGRDQLGSLWPEIYSQAQSAELPSEEFHQATPGANYGWPYTYYDHIRGDRMVAPEYGGDGKTKAPDGKYQDPLLAFPGHWAPNDLLFYTGKTFPSIY